MFTYDYLKFIKIIIVAILLTGKQIMLLKKKALYLQWMVA
jgi:hypothetical protein